MKWCASNKHTNYFWGHPSIFNMAHLLQRDYPDRNLDEDPLILPSRRFNLTNDPPGWPRFDSLQAREQQIQEYLTSVYQRTFEPLPNDTATQPGQRPPRQPSQREGRYQEFRVFSEPPRGPLFWSRQHIALHTIIPTPLPRTSALRPDGGAGTDQIPRGSSDGVRSGPDAPMFYTHPPTNQQPSPRHQQQHNGGFSPSDFLVTPPSTRTPVPVRLPLAPPHPPIPSISPPLPLQPPSPQPPPPPTPLAQMSDEDVHHIVHGSELTLAQLVQIIDTELHLRLPPNVVLTTMLNRLPEHDYRAVIHTFSTKHVPDVEQLVSMIEQRFPLRGDLGEHNRELPEVLQNVNSMILLCCIMLRLDPSEHRSVISEVLKEFNVSAEAVVEGILRCFQTRPRVTSTPPNRGAPTPGRGGGGLHPNPQSGDVEIPTSRIVGGPSPGQGGGRVYPNPQVADDEIVNNQITDHHISVIVTELPITQIVQSIQSALCETLPDHVILTSIFDRLPDREFRKIVGRFSMYKVANVEVLLTMIEQAFPLDRDFGERRVLTRPFRMIPPAVLLLAIVMRFHPSEHITILSDFLRAFRTSRSWVVEEIVNAFENRPRVSAPIQPSRSTSASAATNSSTRRLSGAHSPEAAPAHRRRLMSPIPSSGESRHSSGAQAAESEQRRREQGFHASRTPSSRSESLSDHRRKEQEAPQARAEPREAEPIIWSNLEDLNLQVGQHQGLNLQVEQELRGVLKFQDDEEVGGAFNLQSHQELQRSLNLESDQQQGGDWNLPSRHPEQPGGVLNRPFDHKQGGNMDLPMNEVERGYRDNVVNQFEQLDLLPVRDQRQDEVQPEEQAEQEVPTQEQEQRSAEVLARLEAHLTHSNHISQDSSKLQQGTQSSLGHRSLETARNVTEADKASSGEHLAERGSPLRFSYTLPGPGSPSPPHDVGICMVGDVNDCFVPLRGDIIITHPSSAVRGHPAQGGAGTERRPGCLKVWDGLNLNLIRTHLRHGDLLLRVGKYVERRKYMNQANRPPDVQPGIMPYCPYYRLDLYSVRFGPDPLRYKFLGYQHPLTVSDTDASFNMECPGKNLQRGGRCPPTFRPGIGDVIIRESAWVEGFAHKQNFRRSMVKWYKTRAYQANALTSVQTTEIPVGTFLVRPFVDKTIPGPGSTVDYSKWGFAELYRFEEGGWIFWGRDQLIVDLVVGSRLPASRAVASPQLPLLYTADPGPKENSPNSPHFPYLVYNYQ